MLPDGTYDAMVIDATESGTHTTLELTIVSGAHKGELVAIRATDLGIDELDLLGMPGTLVVEIGVPMFRVER